MKSILNLALVLMVLMGLVCGRHMPRSEDTMDVAVHGFMQVSDEVEPGMRIQKYAVEPLKTWPDGTPVTQEAAPYILIGVPN